MIGNPKSHGFSRWVTAAAVTTGALVVLAACSSSKTKTTTSGSTSTSAPAGTSTTSSSASAIPATMFSTANVPGLGTVLVDARGRTVYLLTSGDHTNVPCEDSNGCTKVWPDLPLPAGVTGATAGLGVQPSLLSTMKSSGGETYPTYGGWLMYEYTGDTGPAQGHGQRIPSFGGTWYAISPTGNPVTATAASSTTPSSATGY